MPRSFAPLLFLCAATAFAQSAKVSPQLLVPKYAPIGGRSVVTVSAVNFGPGAQDVAFTYEIPPGTTFASAATGNGNPKCTTPSAGFTGSVDCSVKGLAVNASASVAVTLNIPGTTSAGTQFTHYATATGPFPDPNPQDNVTTATNLAEPAPFATVGTNFPSSAIAGATITFNVSIRNAGLVSGPVALVESSKLPPQSFAFVSMSQTSGPPFTCSLSQAQCTATSFAAGATATFAMTLQTSPTLSSSSLDMSSTLVFTDYQLGFGATQSASINQIGDVSMTLSGPANATVGDDVPYTILVKDAGPSASTPTVKLTLPLSVKFLALSAATDTAPLPLPTCTTPAVGVTGTVTCNLGQLMPAAPPLVASAIEGGFILHVRPTATGSFTITPNATSSDTTDPDLTNNSATATTAVASNERADLVLTIAADKTNITEGDVVTYDITLTNSGPSPAANAMVSDTLPSGATVTRLDAGCDGTSTIVCSAGTLAAGATAEWHESMRLVGLGTITNSVTASSDTADPNLANNTASASVAASATHANLAISVTPSKTSAQAGDDVRYAVNIINNGPDIAFNAVMTATLPAGTPVLAVTAPCSVSDGAIRCTFDKIAVSANVTIDLAAPPAAGAFTVTFAVASDAIDIDPSNDTASATVTVTGTPPAGDADVAISATLDPVALTGGTITFAATIANNGPADAKNVTVTFTDVPGIASLTSSNIPAPFTCGTGVPLTCTAATLPVGATINGSVAMRVFGTSEGMTGSAAARIASGNHDPDLTNNAASATTSLVDANLFLLSIDPPLQVVAIGGTASWTIKLTNAGSVTAPSVAITDFVSAGLDVKSAVPSSGNCTISGSTVACTLGAFAPSDTATIVVTATAKQSGTLLTTAAVAAKSAVGVVAVPVSHHRAATHP